MRLFKKLLLLPLLLFLASISGSGATWPAAGWSMAQHHEVHMATADRVSLDDPGIHTHGNYIEFQVTPDFYIDAMLKDKRHEHFRALRLVGHSRLDTDHAKLPGKLSLPGFLVDYYGPIDGQEHGARGWGIIKPEQTPPGRIWLGVPSRFVNWLDSQPSQVQNAYRQPQSYSLDLSWQQR